MPPRTNCSQPSYTEGNASGRPNRRCYACTATVPRLRKRLQVSDLEGAAAGIADQSTLQRLLSLTSNLKLIVRDVAHASRRVTAKPEAADEHLEKLTRRLFTDKNSITQIIEHSRVWRREFASFVEARKTAAAAASSASAPPSIATSQG